MKVLVTTFSEGKVKVLDLPLDSNTNDLIEKYERISGLDKDIIRFIFAGKEYRWMESEAPILHEIGMRDLSLVQLVARLPGGGSETERQTSKTETIPQASYPRPTVDASGHPVNLQVLKIPPKSET